MCRPGCACTGFFSVNHADEPWTVKNTPSWVRTRTLAEEVRKDLDRRDPLPCPHEGRIFVRHSLGGRHDFLCGDCGKAFESDPREVT